jgi:hypothetical protein
MFENRAITGRAYLQNPGSGQITGGLPKGVDKGGNLSSVYRREPCCAGPAAPSFTECSAVAYPPILIGVFGAEWYGIAFVGRPTKSLSHTTIGIRRVCSP